VNNACFEAKKLSKKSRDVNGIVVKTEAGVRSSYVRRNVEVGLNEFFSIETGKELWMAIGSFF
jgi:hypothetical protein